MISIQPITNIIPHPNADRLNLINLGGYQYISNKDTGYKLGDLVLTIPEEHDVSKYLDIINKYFNINQDGIVRRMQLRGAISQGIIVSAELLAEMGFNINELPVGEDLCEVLGIPEWVRPIPPELIDSIESYKHPLAKFHDCVYPAASTIPEGAIVTVTEKLHGTQCNLIKDTEGNIYVSSKGLLKSKFVFKQDVDNIYTKAVNKLISNNPWLKESNNDRLKNREDYIQVVGEVIPAQKGYSYGYTEPTFKVFGLYINGKYIPYYRNYFSEEDCVPLVYEGPLKPEHYTYDDKTNRYSLLDDKTICEGYCIAGRYKEYNVIKVKSKKFLDKNKGEE